MPTPNPADPCHYPATMSKTRVVVDGDCDGLTWAARWCVYLPEVGTVGEFDKRADAVAILAAYCDTSATRASVAAAWASVGVLPV